MKLLVLFLKYGEDKYPGSFNTLFYYLEQIKCEKIYIIIDNKCTLPKIIISENINYINGDNSEWEFSGWDKGLSYAKNAGFQYDLVLVVNDSFMVYGSSFIQLLKLFHLEYIACSSKSIVGQVDSRGYPMSVFGYNVYSWIRTSAFLIHPDIIRKLGQFTSINSTQLNVVFPLKYEPSIFLNSAPMNESYKKMLVDWLTVDSHSKFDISDKTWIYFKSKVLAIINESLLTARISSYGYTIVSFDQLFRYNFIYRRIQYVKNRFFGKF